MEAELSDTQNWLDMMIAEGASDLHIATDRPLVIRVHGTLRTVGPGPVSRQDIDAFMRSILPPAALEKYQATHDLDTAFQNEQGRFRVNCFLGLNGPGLVLRSIALTPPTLEAIATPPVIAKLTGLHNGLVIVTGPTGSGKSSTLAAMVRHINQHSARHILTLEDPVEFVHQPQGSVITQREVGVHTESFKSGLKAALREDPDVILVGELRDHETISLALTAAETGHLVFGTLHTNSAHRAILRLVDSVPAGQREVARAMLGNSLQAVIAQILVKAANGGRCAAFEILIGTHAVRNLIMEDQIAQLYSLMQMGGRHQMQTMDTALDGLMHAGKIDPATVEATLRGLQGSSIADEEHPEREVQASQAVTPQPAKPDSRQPAGDLTF